MAHRSTRSTYLLAAVALTVSACGGGSNVSNSSPRITAVPLQSTTGSAAFTLDLEDYVTDREAATLTYAVTSGGGAFADSVYSNTFDTMGNYTVEFTVTDGAKTTDGSFVVRVTSANLVVVQEDNSGLQLLDSRTNAFVRVAASTATPSMATGLGDGRLVYQVAGATQSLFVFDPLNRTSTQLGADESGDATYMSKAGNKVLFTTGTSNDRQLFLYNPVTGLTRNLAQGLLSTATVLADSGDIVYYEVGVSGQADIYAYDIDEDQTFAVGTATTDEQLQAVLPDDGVVFSRVGTSGAGDLLYFKVSTGLVEVGADNSSLDLQHKVFSGNSTDSKVVFTAENGAVRGLYSWNPATGDTIDVSGTTTGASVWNTYRAIGAGNEVVFSSAASSAATDIDAFYYDLDTGTNSVLRNGADESQVLGVSSDGTTAYAFLRASAATSSLLAVSLVGSPATVTWAAGSAVATSLGILANGDVVAQRTAGTALAVFDVSVATWGTPITGVDVAFAGDGLDAGDFVYTLTVSSQTDLSMWDASATGSVVVSNTSGNDVFQTLTDDNTILFTRVVGTNTNADLFVWNGTTATQLTDVDEANLLHNHTVLGTYVGTR